METKFDNMRKELSDYLKGSPNEKTELELKVFDIMRCLREGYEAYEVSNNDFMERISSISEIKKSNGSIPPERAKQFLDSIVDEYEDSRKFLQNIGCFASGGKSPAFIVVLNFDELNTRQVAHIDNGIWYENRQNLNTQEGERILKDNAYKDNAVLVNENGDIIAEQVYLSVLNPKKVKTDDYLDENVSSRGKSTRAFSYAVKRNDASQIPVVVYTLSEETGNIRRLQDGWITHSTFPEEVKYRERSMKNILRRMYEKVSKSGAYDPRASPYKSKSI